MKFLLTIALVVVVLTAVYQCNPSPEQDVEMTTWQRNLDDEKDEFIQELNKLNEVVEEQLEYIVSVEALADEHMQKRIASVEKRLRIEKSEINKTMRDVRHSSENTWDDVKDDVQDKLTDVKIEVSRVREKIRNEIDINNL